MRLPNRRKGREQLDNVIRAIPVRDSHGDALTLYEFQVSGASPVTMALGGGGATTRLALDTGEAVRRVDEDTFVIAATGERLVRIG